MLAWTSLHYDPDAANTAKPPENSTFVFKIETWSRLLLQQLQASQLVQDSFRQFVVGHAFPYKMQLVSAVKEGQFHNLIEQVQANSNSILHVFFYLCIQQGNI